MGNIFLKVGYRSGHSLGKALWRAVEFFKLAVMHNTHHVAKGHILGNPFKRRNVCPHVIDNGEAYGHLLFLKLPRLCEKPFVADPYLERIPRAPAEILEYFGNCALGAHFKPIVKKLCRRPCHSFKKLVWVLALDADESKLLFEIFYSVNICVAPKLKAALALSDKSLEGVGADGETAEIAIFGLYKKLHRALGDIFAVLAKGRSAPERTVIFYGEILAVIGVFGNEHESFVAKEALFA